MSRERDFDDWAESVQYGGRVSSHAGELLTQVAAPAGPDLPPIQMKPCWSRPVRAATTETSSLGHHIEQLLGLSHRLSQANVVVTTPSDEPDFSEFDRAQTSSATPSRIRHARSVHLLPMRTNFLKPERICKEHVGSPTASSMPFSRLMAADMHSGEEKHRPGRKTPMRGSRRKPLERAASSACTNDPIEPEISSMVIASQGDSYDQIESSWIELESSPAVNNDPTKRPSWLDDFDFDDDIRTSSPRPAAKRRSEADSYCDSGRRPKRGSVGELCSKLKLIECRLVSSRSIFHNNHTSSRSGLDLNNVYLILTDTFYTRSDLHLCYCRSRSQDGTSDSFQILISDDEWHVNALQIGTLIRISLRDRKRIWQPPNELPLIAATSVLVETQVSEQMQQWVEESLKTHGSV